MDPFLAELIKQGAAWLCEQRDLHRADTSALRSVASFGLDLSAFFDDEILAHTRFKIVSGIENPAFYRELERQGLPPPLDFSNMAGITFADTVLLSRRAAPDGKPADTLVFHALVHAVQYRCLGIHEFIARYVTGWDENGRDYASIPLERDAYWLEGRYEADRQQGFSVAAEVSRSLGLVD